MSLTFQKSVLPNGLTVIGEHNPQAQSFAAGYFVKTGSRDEAPEVAGVSHFLEHMMFKGTASRSAEDINREFDELGARYNAYTSDERTVYYGSVLKERAEELLDLLSDMMRPSLNDADFDLEKNVILEEIAMYQDRPSFKVFEEGNKQYFKSHPLGNSVLGSVASIRALSLNSMRDYFKQRYAPNNLILTLAGNYDWEARLEQAQRLTGSWPPQDCPRSYPELLPASGLEHLPDPKVKRVHVAAYAPGVSAQDPLRYAAAILASCLGDSSGSRLYWALVDRGLADSAALSHDSADGLGTFVGYLSCSAKEAPQVLEIFKETLLSAQGSGLSEEEWARAQRKIATGLTLSGETPFGRLMSLGTGYMYLAEYRSVQDTVRAIMTSSLKDAHDLLAARPFDKLLMVTLGPAGS